MRRSGYTLIELVGAMTAASVMLVALASSVVVSTSLIEPTDIGGTLARDRAIADRLSNDLRYATSINTQSGYGMEITRPDFDGVSTTLNYEAYIDGLIRQVSGGARVELDPLAPGISQYVDGYSAATAAANTLTPRVIGVSHAVTDGTSASSLTVDLPSNSRPGDLLILVTAYRNSFFLTPSSVGWNNLDARSNFGITLRADYLFINATTPLSHLLSVTPGADAAAVLMVVERPRTSMPIAWVGTGTGNAVLGDSSTYPAPLENPGAISANSLQLQFFAAADSPWPQGTLGIAAFTDCVRLVGSPGASGEVSLGIAMRNGPMPSLTNAPSVWQVQSGRWVTIATQIEGAMQ